MKPYIHICGYIPHSKLETIYNACDSFLFCYRCDNFPGALIEACLSGKNVVYLSRGGCTEIMNSSSKYFGLKFDGENDEELVENAQNAIIKSIQNLQKYTAEKIYKKYMPKKIIERICDAYHL